MKEIEAIKAALASGPTPGTNWHRLNTACNPAAMQKIIAHIEAQDAEIAANEIAFAEYRQQCIDNHAEIERLRAESDERLKNTVAQAMEIERLRIDAGRLRKGLSEVEVLIHESAGVYGLHLNGDLAPWSSLRTGGGYEDWLAEFDAALKETP